MEAANEPLPRGATGTAWRRPDARALISRIMALRMQHRAQLSDAVEFDDAL